MIKIINAILCLIILVISVDTRAADNLTLSKYTSASQIPSSLLSLGGGSSLINKTYQDDNNKSRSDKVYYAATHSYNSTYRLADLEKLLNPSQGKLASLFEDTVIRRKSKGDSYDVLMLIKTPLTNFDCQSVLNFTLSKMGKKTVFTYKFSDFNMVFTSMAIQIEAEEVGSYTKIKLSQISAVKGSTYAKLNKYFAVGRFEKSLKSNLQTFRKNIGGI